MAYSENPTVTCTANENQLITQTLSVNTDVAGLVSSTAFTVPTGRGRVKRIQIIALSQTLADLNSRDVTILINGVQVIVSESFTKFSNFFTQITREYRVDWPEKAQITVNVTAGTAVSQTLDVCLFFVD